MHEIAQQIIPEARIVYVDIDPVAVAHSRAILAGNDLVAVLQADVREPQKILADAGADPAAGPEQADRDLAGRDHAFRP